MLSASWSSIATACLVVTVDLDGDERGLALTKEGRDLLDSHTLERGGGTQQAFHAGVSRPREIEHDSNLYATFRREEARLRGAHAASRTKTGFRIYVVASRGGGGRPRPHPRIMEDFL